MKILIVDDKEENIYLLNSLFSGNGFEVINAHNGKEALDLLSEHQCDIIISDILMPVMDGFELCRQIKSNSKLKNIPFVFYTATYTDKKDEEFALSLGASLFITKPQEPDVFLKKIRRLMEDVSKGNIITRKPIIHKEKDVFKLYNERLIKKIEKKMLELEKEREERNEIEKQNQILAQAVKSISECVCVTDMKDRFIFVNEAFEKTYGYTLKELYGKPAAIVRSPNNPKEYVKNIYKDTLAEGWRGELNQLKKEGTEFPVYLSTSKVQNEKGQTIALIGVANDITERKKLEEQYRQAQKMEAVGRLAGGIAHDFNNILTVINGYTELMRMRLDEKDPIFTNLGEVKKAGKRAEILTRQLLAFSRKQVLQPVVLDLNSVIHGLEKMLLRLITENIEMITLLEPVVGKIKADPGQIEQVIMNLVINARDAMPKGGKLTIETKNVTYRDPFVWEETRIEPGEYVMLAIRDTGLGMNEETLEHIFEPFFTTKKEGEGTGLGLSMVYGIVKQSDGFIKVDSEPGKGSVFRLYFPCTKGPVTKFKKTEISSDLLKGSETILITEDEDDVRHFASEVLRMHGYNVLEASNGGMALLKCENYKSRIHLLITDVVMPEMSGSELIARLKSLHREMKVLYMSGYTDDAVIKHGIPEKKVNFLQKPFSPYALLEKVRKVLDSR
ncbi:MAG: response regulator [Calditrichaceae bacterium]|nr:response regulator [Calditrichaceae bacterium]MBN2710295.1 response regulator [Calditrichaceae bacterium]RQV92999.1 MAG: response regulator [Calditrichota bacterium]